MIVLRILHVLVVVLSFASAEYHVDDADAYISSFDEENGLDEDIFSDESSVASDELNDFDALHYPFLHDSLPDVGKNATRRKLPTVADQNTRRARGRSRGKARKISDLESILAQWFKHRQHETADKDTESTTKKPAEEDDEEDELNLSPLHKPYWPNMPHKTNKKHGSRKTKAKHEGKTKVEKSSNVTEENDEPVKNLAKHAVHKKHGRVKAPGKRVKHGKKLRKVPKKKTSEKNKTINHNPEETSRRFLAEEKPQEVLRGRVVVNWKEGSEKSMAGRLKNQILSVFAQIRQAIASVEPIVWASGDSANETDGSTSKKAVFNVMIEQPKDPRENELNIERESEEAGEQSRMSSHQSLSATQHVHKHIRRPVPAGYGLHKPVEDLSSSESEEDSAAKRSDEEKQELEGSDEGSSEGSGENNEEDDERKEKLREKLLRELRKLDGLTGDSSKDQKDTSEEKEVKNKTRHRHVEENADEEKPTTGEHPEHTETGNESSDKDLQSIDQHRRRLYSNQPTESKTKSKPLKS